MTPFNKDDFAPHLSTVFEVQLPDQTTIPITLREVREYTNLPYAGFMLMFTGSSAHVFRHDTYRVKHPVLGECEIFLGPVSVGPENASVIHYQAIFSLAK